MGESEDTRTSGQGINWGKIQFEIKIFKKCDGNIGGYDQPGHKLEKNIVDRFICFNRFMSKQMVEGFY